MVAYVSLAVWLLAMGISQDVALHQIYRTGETQVELTIEDAKVVRNALFWYIEDGLAKGFDPNSAHMGAAGRLLNKTTDYIDGWIEWPAAE